jgi:peptidyl-prolyl cis-trans isomerase C
MRAAACICLAVCIGLSQAEASPANGQTPTDSGSRIAVSDGKVGITVAELNARIRELARRLGSPGNLPLSIVRHIAKDLLTYRILAEQARDMGLDKRPQVVLALKLQAERLLGEARLDELFVKPSSVNLDELAKEYYLVHQEAYDHPAQSHLRHILIGTKDRTDAQAKVKAEEVLAELRQHPEHFEDLARRFSDDPGSAGRGGDLGWRTPKGLVKPFAEAAFAIRTPGDIVGPVKTQFGYHLIQLVTRRAAGRSPFSEVKDAIIKSEGARLRSAARNEYLSHLYDPSRLVWDESLQEKGSVGGQTPGLPPLGTEPLPHPAAKPSGGAAVKADGAH